MGTVKIQCKEAADCPTGYVCCESFPAAATLGSTSCMQSCNPPVNYQICRTNSECSGGDSGAPAQCIPQTCTAPSGMFGGSGGGGQMVTIEACSYTAPMGGTMGGGNNNGALPYCMPN
jgi:hypothetical protein